jgi:hypothetical protein
MARIRELFPNTMSLDYDTAAITARRAQVRSAVDPDKVDAVELFARFYEEQVGNELDGEQRALVTRVVRQAQENWARGADRAGRAEDGGGGTR